jgi:hypothetical protein
MFSEQPKQDPPGWYAVLISIEKFLLGTISKSFLTPVAEREPAAIGSMADGGTTGGFPNGGPGDKNDFDIVPNTWS